MASRLAEPLQRATRGAVAIVLAGAFLGLAVLGLVAGSPRMYEAETILSAPAPALLVQHDRLVSRTDAIGEGVADGDDSLDRADLGDVGAIAAQALERSGTRVAGTAVALRIDDVVNEAAVVVRARHPDRARRIADDIAAGIVRAREAATSNRQASVRAELWLVSRLASRDHRLRSRAAALRTNLAALAQLRRISGSGLTVLRPARTPTEPVSPRMTRDVILATVLGMVGWVTLTRLRKPHRSLVGDREPLPGDPPVEV